MSDRAIVIDTPEGIHFVRLLSLRGSLRLEMRGLRRHGRSASAVVKKMFGLNPKCRRETALVRLEQEIETKMKERLSGK